MPWSSPAWAPRRRSGPESRRTVRRSGTVVTAFARRALRHEPDDHSPRPLRGLVGMAASSPRRRAGARSRGDGGGFPLHELALVAAREAWASAGEGLARRAPRSSSARASGRDSGVPRRRRPHRGGARARAARASPSPRRARRRPTPSASACDLLLRGHADVVVAGRRGRAAARGLRRLLGSRRSQRRAVRPFQRARRDDARRGGGLRRARARDATPVAAARCRGPAIHGYGLSADGFHETTPDPSGAGVARAIRGALRDAGWSASDSTT